MRPPLGVQVYDIYIYIMHACILHTSMQHSTELTRHACIKPKAHSGDTSNNARMRGKYSCMSLNPTRKQLMSGNNVLSGFFDVAQLCHT